MSQVCTVFTNNYMYLYMHRTHSTSYYVPSILFYFHIAGYETELMLFLDEYLGTRLNLMLNLAPSSRLECA